jgi:hypothetical protein
MFELFFCGYNLFCHIDNVKHTFSRPKYPPDVAQLCYYFEEQKSELPEYCKWKSDVKPPRRRSDF